MRVKQLLMLALVTSLAAACRRSAPPGLAPSDAQDFVQLLHDSAARAGPDPFEVCAGGGYTSFVVEVLDSVTLKPAAWGAHLMWRVGRLVDGAGPLPKYPMRVEDIRVISGPHGRPGTYDVVVSKPGYRDWYRAGIVVEGTTEPHGGLARCTITKPVYLRALLQRAPRR
ncbi:MAG: carboxypeptidase-like regulatory domain-containing protein [Gemmatimonadota bacterium]|nr:carboxypeptidase-like regulatory domain-containing protein [Gemmatimonadota bacterium]